jgi:hypothetical protein
MHRGTQFEFTEDFGQFKMGQIYIFCQHVSNGDRVVFVRIIDSDHAIPLRMPRIEFERALDRSVIRPCDPQVTLPKAANHALGTTIELIDANRQKKYQKDDGKKSITKKKLLNMPTGLVRG